MEELIGLMLDWVLAHPILDLIGILFIILIAKISAQNQISVTSLPSPTEEKNSQVSRDGTDNDAYSIKVVSSETGAVLYNDRAQQDDFDHDPSNQELDYLRVNGERVILFTGRNLVVIEDA